MLLLMPLYRLTNANKKNFLPFLTRPRIAVPLATRTRRGLGSRPLDVEAGAPLQTDTGGPPPSHMHQGLIHGLKREQSKIAPYLFGIPVVNPLVDMNRHDCAVLPPKNGEIAL